MLETVFRTEDLPVADRFDCWYQMIRSSILPAIVNAEATGDFPAATRALGLDSVQVHTMQVPPVRASRPARLVRQSDPEQCHLILVLRGAYGFTGPDRDTVLGVGDMLFFHSSCPFDGWTRGTGRAAATSRQVHVHFPRVLLPSPALVDRLVGARLTAAAGVRALLAGYLRELVNPAARYRALDSARLATTVVDLVAALLAHELDVTDTLPHETAQRTLLARVHGFIREHLGDPGLAPGAIAAAHHISVRYLHKLFQTEGMTVAAWVRQRRLEQCRRDLGDPGLDPRPISAIAARWGFTDNAHFSRLFRAAYGMSPSDHRRFVRERTTSPSG